MQGLGTDAIAMPKRTSRLRSSALTLALCVAIVTTCLSPSHATASGIVGLSKAVRLPSDIPGPPDPFVVTDTGEAVTAIPVKGKPIVIIA
jgi:hypothetical protein